MAKMVRVNVINKGSMLINPEHIETIFTEDLTDKDESKHVTISLITKERLVCNQVRDLLQAVGVDPKDLGLE